MQKLSLNQFMPIVLLMLVMSFSHSDSPVMGQDAPQELYFIRESLEGEKSFYLLDMDTGEEKQLSSPIFSADTLYWASGYAYIAYTQMDDERNFDIYLVDTDAESEERFTLTEAFDYMPHISPDESQLLYISNTEQNNLYLSNIDGSEEQILFTEDDTILAVPRWSPDGTQVAFVANYETESYEIYVMDADGTNLSRITDNRLDPRTVIENVLWSPDGSQLAYQLDDKYYLMNADGTNQHLLWEQGMYQSFAAWSPDSSKMAFVAFQGGDFDIYVAELDSGEVQRLTDGSRVNSTPAWSPDGSQLVFVSTGDDGNSEIYIMDADGSNQTRITDTAENESYPHWRPAES